MALADPLPMSGLFDKLSPIADCTFSLRRFEEGYGAGSGQQWTAALSRPLYEVQISLQPRQRAKAAEVSAIIRALGSTGSFLFRDPAYRPTNGRTAGGSPVISAVAATREAITLSGLPAGYLVTAGDRLSISYPGGRTFFAEFANGGGNGVALALTAWLPVSVPVGASVNLDAPRIRVRIPPDGFIPFLDLPGGLSVGGALTLVQKL